jgi:hypothetical protein
VSALFAAVSCSTVSVSAADLDSSTASDSIGVGLRHLDSVWDLLTVPQLLSASLVPCSLPTVQRSLLS